MTKNVSDTRAPMPSAPMVYNDDDSVAWDQMWDSFCVLASVGGPPHRGTMLYAQEDVDPQHPTYQWAVNEIRRGVKLVSGLDASPDAPGWIAVECGTNGKAAWLATQIEAEQVQARSRGTCVLLPVSDHYTLTGEIKNVITVVAKTTHYWDVHVQAELKTVLEWETKLKQVVARLRGWVQR